MSNWKELPNEILCELFEQSGFGFSSRDLVECQLVCKNWRNHHIGKFTECMQNSTLGSLVQDITFWCPSEDDIPNHHELIASSIYKLAKVCPNVEISKGDLHANYWNALGEAARSYWKQLKQRPEPRWSMYNDQTAFVNYYALASVCCRTLTHITLPRTLPSSREFKRVLPLLPSFINLTHLTVTPTYNIPTLMDFDEAISQCPNLVYFSIDSGLNMEDERSPNYFKRYDILSMQPHSKLKMLDVITELHCDTFEYIMHKFPNLEHCSVYLPLDEDYNHHMGSWIARDYPEKLREFQEYLNNRSCDRFCTYGSIPLIKEYLQRITNPVVRISSTKPISPLLEIQHDNITWIIHNTVENIDRLKELLKYQNVIKEIYLNMPVIFGVCHLTYVLLSECKGLEKFTYKKGAMFLLEAEFPNPGQAMSSSLITLKLISTKLQPQVLSAYSCALPELRNLIIEAIYTRAEPLSFVVDMPRTKFNHLQVHLDSDLFIINMTEGEITDISDRPALLEITSQKSGLKQFLVNFTSSNQVEELTTNKEYGWSFVIKCACIDFVSISIDKSRILKEYPLFL